MASGPDSGQVEALRSFNRFYTRQIGVLGDGLLGTRFSLTQARVLFELGSRKRATAGELGEELGLDNGYLSRILQGFSAQGLITRRKSATDGRSRLIALTTKGRREFAALDSKSRCATSSVLARLPDSHRHRFLAALRSARDVLSERSPTAADTVVIRTHRIGDVGWAIERHARLYADEYEWNEEFEALVARLFARFATEHDSAKERFWVAELAGERVGCVFVAKNEDDRTVAQLRCLLVDSKARGKGVGRRLVDKCIAFSRDAGYAKLMLWTNDVLESARRIYEAAGLSLVREERHHSFGHDLVGQIWSLDLR